MKQKTQLFINSLLGFLIGLILSIPFSYPTNWIIPLSIMILFGYTTIFYYYRKE
ncbi:hypothetical protein [Floccifex sp.]|uniref:hypothetical protein n=1 Tax=Floccifex sp. TaxID=2815810 RepID=UPI002A75BA33|nr:hypothetical protein [Floccifex sp.]MDD7280494.1 hypothetical protein [Erysipelotrichaceae bacterium]MDY2958552.1 hypothetical protein [Floccifex sp.]